MRTLVFVPAVFLLLISGASAFLSAEASGGSFPGSLVLCAVGFLGAGQAVLAPPGFSQVDVFHSSLAATLLCLLVALVLDTNQEMSAGSDESGDRARGEQKAPGHQQAAARGMKAKGRKEN